jgi:hypothetical protein
VVRLVHREHVVGERTQDTWHPPSKPGNRAAVLAQSEGLAVLQHVIGQLACSCDPDPADDRELDLDDRPGCPQPCDPGGRIAEKLLAGEIRSPDHGFHCA